MRGFLRRTIAFVKRVLTGGRPERVDRPDLSAEDRIMLKNYRMWTKIFDAELIRRAKRRKMMDEIACEELSAAMSKLSVRDIDEECESLLTELQGLTLASEDDDNSYTIAPLLTSIAALSLKPSVEEVQEVLNAVAHGIHQMSFNERTDSTDDSDDGKPCCCGCEPGSAASAAGVCRRDEDETEPLSRRMERTRVRVRARRSSTGGAALQDMSLERQRHCKRKRVSA
ncbi:unnamed protein product [Vitrella brassicaformis CCMP3155]|uniref:Uncharacterized protein n=2 Tax=Vitrella brassicaformis TaxID=1169539 RepID=A0A0G4ERM5_VITBC|nr:unnamed protein product [Vitrella brassicaformis CCMP3155]|eukprot:CEM00522.1 unnamed protein product [Vitrella brassicaformis CCMP3155]